MPRRSFFLTLRDRLSPPWWLRRTPSQFNRTSPCRARQGPIKANPSGLRCKDLVEHQLDRLVQILAGDDMWHRELE
jgi:hypothetical protein